jgi:putative endonuclease
MATNPRSQAPSWQVYILRCGDGSLYTGIARDVAARLAQHAAGKGARYTRGRGPLSVIYVVEAASHGAALRREAAIRRLGRAGKEALARGVTGSDLNRQNVHQPTWARSGRRP